MSPITTHVLDTSIGRPAAGVNVVLAIEAQPGRWKEIGRGATDRDGRLASLLAPSDFVEGAYRLTFETGKYFGSRNVPSLYPEISVIFSVSDARQHYHIPLLLSPFGYSTYRGS
jgi:5-hydroxyisourate hydrolase